VVGKKLGLTLVSEKTDGDRIYRVVHAAKTALAIPPDTAAAPLSA
jgi:hypothetical protein